MKVTQIGPVRPVTGSSQLGGGGGTIDGGGENFGGGFPPSGQVPTSTGSNTWAWASNVQLITADGSNKILSPFVNFASGSNIIFTFDGLVGSVPSNTIRIHSTGGGGGGGGGAPVDAKYVVTTSDGTLSNEIVIPGFAGHIDKAAGGGSDQEFDTTDTSDPLTGLTTVGTPTAADTNSTKLSHLYIRKDYNAGAIAITGYGVSWTPSAGQTVTCKMQAYQRQTGVTSNRFGLFVGTSSPGALRTIARGEADNKILVDAWTNPTTYSSTPGNITPTDPGPWIYFRIRFNSSTSIDFQYSWTGDFYRDVVTGHNPGFTIGLAGCFVNPDSSLNSSYHALFDWLRFA